MKEQHRLRRPVRYIRKTNLEQQDLIDQLAALDLHLQQNLPAFLRVALQKQRRRLLTEMQPEGQAQS